MSSEAVPVGGADNLIDQIKAKISAEVDAMSEEDLRKEFEALTAKKAAQKLKANDPEKKARSKAREKQKRERNKAILAAAAARGITG